MIPNPMEGRQSHDALVMGELDPEVFLFFFAKNQPAVFGRTRGARQALIATFFQRFYDECLRQGVTSKWDPDQDILVEAILSRLNFNPPRKKKNVTS